MWRRTARGLIDDNAVATLKQIGAAWKNNGATAKLPAFDAPVISSNLAKHQAANASWSDDMWIMDFAVDDDFGKPWISNPTVKQPWFEVVLKKEEGFNMIVVAESRHPRIKKYRLEYYQNGAWKSLLERGKYEAGSKIHRFDRCGGEKVRILIDGFSEGAADR